MLKQILLLLLLSIFVFHLPPTVSGEGIFPVVRALTPILHDAVSTEIVLPTLPASRQAGLRYHRQITPPKNIQAIADEN